MLSRFETENSMANAVMEEVWTLFILSVICTSLWNTILVSGHNTSEVNGKISNAMLQMDFLDKTPYQSLLKKHSILPMCHHIEFRTFVFLAQLMNNKYKLDYDQFITFNANKGEKRVSSSGLFVIDPKFCNLKSFFSRCTVMANYLLRHKIITGFSKSDINAVKDFLIKKTFCVDLICTYYVVCTCSNRVVMNNRC